MSKGLDYAFNPHPSVSAIKAAGCSFACRYISTDPRNDANGKNLLPAEKDALLAAGLAIVVVSEQWSASRMLGGYPAGVADASHADAVVSALGMPGIPVYFAADWDAAESEQAAINAYLDGAASVTGRARVGIYGGYFPVSRARAAGKAAYFWGTAAWSGNNWATCGWLPHIMQGAQVAIGGASCDWDTAAIADYGQWPRVEEKTMALPRSDLDAIALAVWGDEFKEFYDENGSGTRDMKSTVYTLFQSLAVGLRNRDAIAALTAQVTALQAKVGDVDEVALAAALAPVIQAAITAAEQDGAQLDAQAVASAVVAAFAGKLSA